MNPAIWDFSFLNGIFAISAYGIDSTVKILSMHNQLVYNFYLNQMQTLKWKSKVPMWKHTSPSPAMQV